VELPRQSEGLDSGHWAFAVFGLCETPALPSAHSDDGFKRWHLQPASKPVHTEELRPMSTDTEAPSVYQSRELTRDGLRDRLLDAIFTTTGLFPRGNRKVRRCPIPEQPLRVLVALLIRIEQAGDATETGLGEQHCVNTRELLGLLPPRKARGTTYAGMQLGALPAIHPDALFMALDWLAGKDLITLAEVGKRRRGHVVRLTLDYELAGEPQWEHARKTALDGVLLKRLSPAQLAILGHLAYGVGEDGAGVFSAGEVEALTGLSWKWVRKQLQLNELGPEHGLESWNVRRQGREYELAVQLCEPDDTEVLGTPLPRFHRSFVAEVLSSRDVAARPENGPEKAAPNITEATADPVVEVPTPGTVDAADAEVSSAAETEIPAPGAKLSPKAEKLSARLNERLAEAAEYNGQGDHVRAGEVLRPVLASIPTHIAPELFAGDAAAARSLIIEAFKRGQHELAGAVTRTSDDWAVDYLPSSSKPHTARLALEGEASPAPKKDVIVDEEVNRTPLPTAPTWDDGYEEDVPFDDEDMAEASETVKTAASEPPTETEAPNPTADEPQELYRRADTADATEEDEAAPPVFDEEPAVDATMEEMRERFGIIAEDEVETASVAS
jgi:hypothetical protein